MRLGSIKMRKFDLEQRLIDYAVVNLNIAEMLPDTKGANHLAGQLVRCGTAPALMYGEAQAAESRRDFIHKMGVALKEIRESFICQKIIDKKNYLKRDPILINVLRESDELISIFVKSIETAKTNLRIQEEKMKRKPRIPQ
jgi:four helix bundle protein